MCFYYIFTININKSQIFFTGLASSSGMIGAPPLSHQPPIFGGGGGGFGGSVMSAVFPPGAYAAVSGSSQLSAMYGTGSPPPIPYNTQGPTNSASQDTQKPTYNPWQPSEIYPYH